MPLSFATGNPARTVIGKPTSARPLKDTLSAALERAQACSPKVPRSPRPTPPPASWPSCGFDMTVITVTPTFRRDDCQDVNYRCEKCGTQMHRQVMSKPVWANRELVVPAALGRAQT